MVQPDRKTLLVWGALAALLLLAAWFRLYDIHNYPPGLFPDEAANGEDVQLILDGDLRPFYPRGNGREALFFYLQAASVAAFGIGVWQLHIVSAAVGIATVGATYFATRVWFGRLAGLLAALFLATSHWHVTLSRTGFRAIMIPLFVALFTAFAGYTVKSVKDGKKLPALIYAALAGASFAGGFYTYIAYRVMIGVVLGIAVIVLLDDLTVEWRRHHAEHLRDLLHVQRYWPHLLVAVLAGLIIFAPLGFYFIQHPQDFIGRAGQVSVFNQALQQEYGGGTLWGTILYSTRETLLALFAGDGDLNWRHNVPGFPLLNPLVGLLFLLGLAWAIHGTVTVALRTLQGKEVHLGVIYPYLLLLLGGMLLPVITTAEGMPHGLRSIGLLLPIFLLAGTAASVTVYWLKEKATHWNVRSAIFGIIAGLLMLGVLYDGALYFMITRNDADAHYAYRADLTPVAAYLNDYAAANPDAPRPYLVLDSFSIQTVHFLTSVAAHEYVKEPQGETHPDAQAHRWVQLDPAQSHLTPLEPGEIIIFTQSTLPDADRYQRTYPNLELVESRRNRFNQEIMRILRHPAAVEGIQKQTPTDPPPSALDA